MSWQVEALASLLLLANVWLVARRSIWNYAFAVAAVSMYAAIFWNARLYAASGLQFIFLALNIYGLILWLRARTQTGTVPVTHLPVPMIAASFAAVAILAVAIGLLLTATTDAALPYWDSANTAGALAGQWWLARRKVENWLFWSLVNFSGAGLYATQGLWSTAATYAILFVVALHGWREWKRAAC